VTGLAPSTATLGAGANTPLSAFHDLADWCDELAAAATAVRFPTARWSQDPVGFAQDVLGASPWWRQVEILNAVRDHDRVTVRSGHKVGKSNTAALLALWFYCSFEDARVLLTSTTARQVEDILWRELKKVRARGERATGIAISPEPHELARSGMKSDDFRQILGFTAKQPEAVAGVSGANLLYIVDEASGVPDTIFEAIEGNRAGGVNAKLVLFSNPTQTSGEFYESHSREKSALYKQICISSEETPNAIEGRIVIPGLASRAWIEQKREEWGEESGLYKVRVKGEFAGDAANAVISLASVIAAVGRHELPDPTPADAPLSVGVDVSRYGEDETIVVVRRGWKVLGIYASGKEEADIVARRVLDAVREHRLPNEPPARVKVDAQGVGAPVYTILQGDPRYHAEIVPVRVMASDRAQKSDTYALCRDQIWFATAEWLKDGGAIPDDAKLEKELVACDYATAADGRRLKVDSKDILREKLKRSPDRADALALSIWDPSLLLDDASIAGALTDRQYADGGTSAGDDPYSPFGGGIDPYAGGGFQ